MGYKLVYGSLTELFPQIDARLLKAVAIEHSKDADEAAAVVISEIVPLFYPNLADYSTQPGNHTPVNEPDNKVESDIRDGVLAGSETGASSGTTPVASNGDLDMQSKVMIGLNGSVERDEQNGVLAGSETGASSGTAHLASNSDHEKRDPIPELISNRDQLTNVMSNGDLDIQSKVMISLNGSTESGVVSSDPPALVQTGTDLTSNCLQGVDINITGSQAEPSTSTVLEEAVHKLDYSAENSKITQKSSRFQFGCAASDALEETFIALMEKTTEGSLAVENGDPELGGAFSSIVGRTKGCNIDHLEQIIEDAKSNKRTLFTVMESIMNLMREVEFQEKDAEKVKEEAARGGFDTLEKVEELKKILKHAKEANDMAAGEVYGERSILTTEVSELENRLLNLSEERDKSLSVLHEMRGILETRLAEAQEIKKAAEQEKQDKKGSARKALAEQESIMEKVVQESKLLQQEAEENSKLRDFLMDRGRIVDSLQGEISVICQDIRLLKEKFDNRVPLSQSITSSQTSCKLASSVSSMKSLLLEKPYETPEASDDNKSPKASVNVEKELLEDGWDFFDKETEL